MSAATFPAATEAEPQQWWTLGSHTGPGRGGLRAAVPSFTAVAEGHWVHPPPVRGTLPGKIVATKKKKLGSRTGKWLDLGSTGKHYSTKLYSGVLFS